VPCAEKYPLNLMQLVLPKGKVEANLLLSFFGPFWAISYSFPELIIANRMNMEITINQQSYQFEQTCSIEELLTSLRPVETKGIAVAVNQTVISKSKWPVYFLKSGDEVMLIKATQGG
jgi:sulfur carrier protein